MFWRKLTIPLKNRRAIQIQFTSINFKFKYFPVFMHSKPIIYCFHLKRLFFLLVSGEFPGVEKISLSKSLLS